MVACPFRRLVVLYQMLTFIMCLMWLMSGYCFYVYLHPLDVSTRGHAFLNNGLNNTECASFLSGLHTKIRIINRVFSGFATCPPCGVWCRGCTTCLMYDGTLSGVWCSKIKLVCNFGILERILFIIVFICLCLNVFLHCPSFACCFSSLYMLTQK